VRGALFRLPFFALPELLQFGQEDCPLLTLVIVPHVAHGVGEGRTPFFLGIPDISHLLTLGNSSYCNVFYPFDKLRANQNPCKADLFGV